MLFRLIFETGLRVGEALALYIEDLDLTSDDEHIRVLGKGGRWRTVLLDDSSLVDSQHKYGIVVVGPVRPNVSWQAKAGKGYDVSAFTIDWEERRVTCPSGCKNSSWTPHTDKWGNQIIGVRFH